MPERQVQFLVFAEYILGFISSDHFNDQHSCFLVHPEVLEDHHKVDGVWLYIHLLIHLTVNGTVCCNERCDDFDSVVGDDWPMDG